MNNPNRCLDQVLAHAAIAVLQDEEILTYLQQ
jgi:hypothetical protein